MILGESNTDAAIAGAKDGAFAGLGTLGLFGAVAIATGMTITGPIAVALVAVAVTVASIVATSRAALGDELSPDMMSLDLSDLSNCFARGTLVQVPGGLKPIEDIVPGDLVMAFDKFGGLAPKRVVRLFHNVTDCWLELSFERCVREA